jgi:hypothetical protein
MPFAGSALNALAVLPVAPEGCGEIEASRAEGPPLLAFGSVGEVLPTVAASSGPQAASANDASATSALMRKEERGSPFIRASRIQRHTTHDGSLKKAGRRWKRSLKSNEEIIVKRLPRKRNALKYPLSERHQKAKRNTEVIVKSRFKAIRH